MTHRKTTILLNFCPPKGSVKLLTKKLTHFIDKNRLNTATALFHEHLEAAAALEPSDGGSERKQGLTAFYTLSPPALRREPLSSAPQKGKAGPLQRGPPFNGDPPRTRGASSRHLKTSCTPSTSSIARNEKHVWQTHGKRSSTAAPVTGRRDTQCCHIS